MSHKRKEKREEKETGYRAKINSLLFDLKRSKHQMEEQLHNLNLTIAALEWLYGRD